MSTSTKGCLSAGPEQERSVATGAGGTARSLQSPGARAAAIAGRRFLSGDGDWWWNGREWVPATTEEGLWRWDGSRWKATVDLESKPPEELAAILALLAEECYAQAGMILAGRSLEWEPEGNSYQLIEQVQTSAIGLRRLDESSGNLAAGRQLLVEEHDALKAEYRTALVRLGRGAPQPSLKDADDMLNAARLFDERAAMLTMELAEADQAERMRAEGAVVATEARRAVETARSARSVAVAEARTHLRSALTPGSGELRAGLGLLRLHLAVLDISTMRLPTAGARAFVATARALWRQHRQRLSDLILLETPAAETFLTALTERSDALFILIIGATGTALWPCPVGREKAAKRFVAAVKEHGREAASVGEGRKAKARQAFDRLDAVTRDRSSVEAAEAELARAEADPRIVGMLDDAHQRLESRDKPELVDARRKVLELARRLTAPPELLKPVT
jgi:hypothetical protein